MYIYIANILGLKAECHVVWIQPSRKVLELEGVPWPFRSLKGGHQQNLQLMEVFGECMMPCKACLKDLQER